MGTQGCILIIEDDPSICQILAHHLVAQGFEVDLSDDGPTGLEKALQGNYVLVILDLNLPRLSGIDVCKSIRRKRESLPLIMLTSRDSEVDRVVGLEVGADDYVVKPFSIFELLARIRARLRVTASSSGASQQSVPSAAAGTGIELRCGPLTLSRERRTATINEVSLDLTRKEFDVLEYLLRHTERIVTRGELLEAIWGTRVAAYEDTVNTLIGRIRRKLAQAAPDVSLIRTVRGIGFRLSDWPKTGDSSDEHDTE